MPMLRSISKDDKPAFGTAEYIWVKDGKLHGKTRVITVMIPKQGDGTPIIEWWTTDGMLLLPAHYVPNPLRPSPAYIVLCEVRDMQDHVVEWNTRAPLRMHEPQMTKVAGIWMGISATFTISISEIGVVLNAFMAAAIDAGIMIHSLSQTDFKVGPRQAGNLDTDPPSPLIVCDHYWIAWYLLQSITVTHAAILQHGTVPNRYYVSTKTSRESSKVARQIADGMKSLKMPHVGIVAPDRGYTTVRGKTEPDQDPYVVATAVVDEIFVAMKIKGDTDGTQKSSYSRRTHQWWQNDSNSGVGPSLGGQDPDPDRAG